MTLLSGLAEPPRRLAKICLSRYASSDCDAHKILGISVPAFGRLSYPLKAFGSININTTSIEMNEAELILSNRIAIFCGA